MQVSGPNGQGKLESLTGRLVKEKPRRSAVFVVLRDTGETFRGRMSI
jgi:hypothetical protein